MARYFWAFVLKRDDKALNGSPLEKPNAEWRRAAEHAANLNIWK